MSQRNTASNCATNNLPIGDRDTANDMQRIAESNRIIHTLYNLPDRFFARRLIAFAREARLRIHSTTTTRNEPGCGSYTASLLWSVIPELSYRLGETRFQTNERFDVDMRAECDLDFRMTVASFLKESSLRKFVDRDLAAPDACYILSHEVANGNPIAIAIDRICPPTEESNDWITRLIQKVGRSRFGFDQTHRTWSPAFAEHKNSVPLQTFRGRWDQA